MILSLSSLASRTQFAAASSSRSLAAELERQATPRRCLPMDIGFTIAVLLIVFLMATAIGFACTGFSRR